MGRILACTECYLISIEALAPQQLIGGARSWGIENIKRHHDLAGVALCMFNRARDD